jgi:hypothetical protein
MSSAAPGYEFDDCDRQRPRSEPPVSGFRLPTSTGCPSPRALESLGAAEATHLNAAARKVAPDASGVLAAVDQQHLLPALSRASNSPLIALSFHWPLCASWILVRLLTLEGSDPAYDHYGAKGLGRVTVLFADVSGGPWHQKTNAS